jgi:hypothetical protein
VTADDIARDLMVNGLQDTIESALVQAAKQGEALIQGKADVLVKRYDDAVAEYKLAFEEAPDFDAALKANRAFDEEMRTLVHLFAAAVGSDEA